MQFPIAFHSIFKLSSLFILSVGLFACGGGASSSGEEQSSSDVITISGYVIDEMVSGATIKVFTVDGETLLAESVTNSEGIYSINLPSDFSGDYRVLAQGGTANGRLFEGEMSSICMKSEIESCHVTPYTTLLLRMAEQYSGDIVTLVSDAKLKFENNLNLKVDPFLEEMQGQSTTSVDLTEWRSALNNGIAINDFNQFVLADLTDGYIDDLSQVFFGAKQRPIRVVTKDDFQINEPLLDVDNREESLIPSEAIVSYRLESQNTPDGGDNVTTSDYLSEVVLLETISYSDINSEEEVSERVVYQSFNVGEWVGQLNAVTTTLINIFIIEPTLILLPNEEKIRVAQLLVSEDMFLDAIDEYEEYLLGKIGANLTAYNILVKTLAELSVDNLSTQLKINSRKNLALKLKIDESIEKDQLVAKSSLETSEKSINSNEIFDVFSGMQLGYDATENNLNIYSKSSLWYGLESEDNYLNNSSWTSATLISPKVGLITKEDFNLVNNTFSDGDSGSVKTDVKLSDIDSSLSADSASIRSIIYRNNPDSWVDAPQLMNTLSVVKVVLKTIGASKHFYGELSSKKVVKKVDELVGSVANFKEDYSENAKIISTVADIALTLAPLLCADTDSVCQTSYSNISKSKAVVDGLFGEFLGLGGEIPNIDSREDYQKIYSTAYLAFRNVLLGKKIKKGSLDYKIVRSVLMSELVIRPMAKTAGLNLTYIDAYTFSSKLFKKDGEAKKRFWEILQKAVKNGYKAHKALTIVSEVKLAVDSLLSISKLVNLANKMSINDIASSVTIFVAKEANAKVSSSVFELIKNLTPAKWLDLVLAGNEVGSIAYDYFTDPSIIKLDLVKQNKQLSVTHSIPDLKALRYLKIPIEDNHLLNYSTPGIDGQIGTAWGSLNDHYIVLGTGSSDNHFLVMSGFEASFENQTAYLETDEDQINELKIQLLWHVKQFETAAENEKVLRENRTEETAFNNNYVLGEADTNGFLDWLSALVVTDINDPVQKAVLGDQIDKYKTIDFSDFYKNITGNGNEYPLQHSSLGIYSDYAEISFSNDTYEQVFANTVNFYVLPDFSIREKVLKADSRVYEGIGAEGSELQITFDAGNNWHIVAHDGLYMVLQYTANDGREVISAPTYISNLVVNGRKTHAFPLPKNIDINDITVILYNDVLNEYAKLSGRGINKTIQLADRYYQLNSEAPIIRLNLADVQRSSQSLLSAKDSDDDGVQDIWDAFPLDSRYQLDSDNDGMPDSWELNNDLDPNNEGDAFVDQDNDSLGNLDEFINGANPNNKDTDGDLIDDAWEVSYGLNVLVNDSGDDIDNDLIDNLNEYYDGTDPYDNTQFIPTLSALNLLFEKINTSTINLEWDIPNRAIDIVFICYATESLPDTIDLSFDCDQYQNGVLIDVSINEDNQPISAQLTGLTAGETYFVRAIAIDFRDDSQKINITDLYSPLSEEIIFTLDSLPNTLPIANAGEDQSVETGSQVTLTGTASIDADGDPLTYAWTIQLKPNGSNVELSDETLQTPTFTPDVAGEYIFDLTVNDGTIDSNVDSVVITVVEPLVAPSNVVVIHGDGQITISWDSVAEADSYNVYLAEESGLTADNINVYAGGVEYTNQTSPFTINNLTNGTPYFVVVTSVNAYGESDESAEVTATPLATNDINLNLGLVAHYEFEGNVNDSSGNANDAIDLGVLEYAQGVDGLSASFNGVDDAVTASLNLESNIFSVSVWAKSLDTRSDPVIQLNDGNGEGAFQMAYGNNQAYIGQGYIGQNAVSVDTSSFNHLVGISDGHTLKLYVNGVLSTEFVAAVDLAQNLEIASNLYSDGSRSKSNLGHPYLGELDQLRIYSRVLSQAEISALYSQDNQQQSIDLANGLVAHYEFEGNANDSSGNGNHGVENGGVGYASGISGQAISFDGVDDYIQIPDSLTFPDNAITMSYWVNRSELASGLQNYISKENAFQSYLKIDNKFESGFWKGVPGYWSGYSSNVDYQNLNEWILYTITFDNDEKIARTYINGVLDASVTETDSNAFLRLSNQPLYIGKNGSANVYYVNGKVDDVRIYNRAINQSEITALYAQGSQSISLNNGLIAHYEFEGNANDSSGNTNHGVENGGVSYASGVSGQAASFDGTNGYISFESVPVLSEEITMSTWVNPSSQISGIGTKGGIILNGADDFEMAITEGTNTLRYAINTASPGWMWIDTGAAVNLNQWSLVSITYDGENVVSYINDVEVHRKAFNGLIGMTSTS